jgi:nicotinamide riboside kinase
LAALKDTECVRTGKLVVFSLDYDGTITDPNNLARIIRDIESRKTTGYKVIVVVNTARLIYGRAALNPDLLAKMNITAVYMRMDTDTKCNSAKHAVLHHLIEMLAKYSPTVIHYDDDYFTSENLANTLQGKLNPVNPCDNKTIIVHCQPTDNTVTQYIQEPNVVFVIGPQCSGKTTLAEQLATKFFGEKLAFVLSMDEFEIKELREFVLKKIHHDGTIPSLSDCRQYLKRNKQNSYQEFLRKIDTLLGNKTPIIICACTMHGKTFLTRQFNNGKLIPAAIFTTFENTDTSYKRLIGCIQARISRNDHLPRILQSCAIPMADHIQTKSTLIENRDIFDAVIRKLSRSITDSDKLTELAKAINVPIHRIVTREEDASHPKVIDKLPTCEVAIRTNTISSIRILFKPADGQSSVVYDMIVACLKKLFPKGKIVIGTNHITISYEHACPVEGRELTVYLFFNNLGADVKKDTSVYIGKSTASVMVAINVGNPTEPFTKFYPCVASTLTTQAQVQSVPAGEYLLSHMTVALITGTKPHVAAAELAHPNAKNHRDMFAAYLKNKDTHIDADTLDDRGMADAMASGKAIFKFTRMVETVVQPTRPERIGKKK